MAYSYYMPMSSKQIEARFPTLNGLRAILLPDSYGAKTAVRLWLRIIRGFRVAICVMDTVYHIKLPYSYWLILERHPVKFVFIRRGKRRHAMLSLNTCSGSGALLFSLQALSTTYRCKSHIAGGSALKQWVTVKV